MKLKQELILADLDNAYEGKLDLRTKIPAFLTPEKTFEIFVKLSKATLKVQNKQFQQIVQGTGNEVDDSVDFQNTSTR